METWYLPACARGGLRAAAPAALAPASALSLCGTQDAVLDLGERTWKRQHARSCAPMGGARAACTTRRS